MTKIKEMERKARETKRVALTGPLPDLPTVWDNTEDASSTPPPHCRTLPSPSNSVVAVTMLRELIVEIQHTIEKEKDYGIYRLPSKSKLSDIIIDMLEWFRNADDELLDRSKSF